MMLALAWPLALVACEQAEADDPGAPDTDAVVVDASASVADAGVVDASASVADAGVTVDAGVVIDAGVDGSSDNASPVILSLSANTYTLTVGETLVITALVTDPDGIDDLIGGQLVGTTGIVYGAFVAPAQEGAYEMQLTWSALNTAEPIEAEPGGSPRTFEAIFFDAGGAQASQTITITLACSDPELALCAGACLDWRGDTENCGQCNRVCPESFGLVGVHRTCMEGACGYTTRLDAYQAESCNAVCSEVSGGTPMPVQCERGPLRCVFFSPASLPDGDRAGCAYYRNQQGFDAAVELGFCGSVPPLTVTSGVGELPLAQQICRCMEY